MVQFFVEDNLERNNRCPLHGPAASGAALLCYYIKGRNMLYEYSGVLYRQGV
jgi:hypothetical protein